MRPSNCRIARVNFSSLFFSANCFAVPNSFSRRATLSITSSNTSRTLYDSSNTVSRIRGQHSITKSLSIKRHVTRDREIQYLTHREHRTTSFRLGQRDAFPSADPSLQAALAHLGLRAPAASWRPWLALAAAHLMAYGDALVRTR